MSKYKTAKQRRNRVRNKANKARKMRKTEAAMKRRSVAHSELQIWWDAGWAYVMPDFDRPGLYVIEWLSDAPPVIPDVAAEQLAADVLADMARSA